MSLTKNFHIVTKNNILLAIMLVSGLALNLAITPAASANNTGINAQICQGGQKQPAFVSSTPANGAEITSDSVNYRITTDWANNLTVRLNGTEVFNQAINYQANLETIVPLSNLQADPTINNIEILVRGGCPETTITQSNTLRFKADVLSFQLLSTKIRSPELHGEINNPDLEVRVYVSGRPGFYQAVNHRDGRWSLPAGTITPELDDGEYDITVENFDTVANSVVKSVFYARGLRIDNRAPVAQFTPEDEYKVRSPELVGAIDEDDARIFIKINGRDYEGINNQDGTWTIPAGTIAALANGRYDIELTFIDRAGNRIVINGAIRINAPDNLGFILAPNTGYLRIGKTNIPGWTLYLSAIVIIAILTLSFRKRKSNQN